MSIARFCLYRNLIAAVVPFLIPTISSAALVVTEVMPQTTDGTPATVNGDWWELTNTGPAAVNLTGYQWADDEDKLPSTDSNFFPNVSIGVGESIIVLEETASSKAAWRGMWGILPSVQILTEDEMVDDSTPDGDMFSGLGNTNDGVFFYNPAGDLLSSYFYAANVRGRSFEQSTGGANLGLSVVGEFGAVMASNGDIGSPGTSTAVPEPHAILLALSGIAAALRSRRRRRTGC
jgi:Lamin Tail Domain